jgi:hypothetical protein
LDVQKDGDDPEANQASLLQSTYPLKKRLDRLELIVHQGVLFPAVINHGTRAKMNSEGRNHIGGIKPGGTPIPHRINQVIIKELIFTTLAKLDPAATKNMGVVTTGLRSSEREKGKEKF